MQTYFDINLNNELQLNQRVKLAQDAGNLIVVDEGGHLIGALNSNDLMRAKVI